MQKTTEVFSQFGPLRCYEDDLITNQIMEFGNHTRPEFAFATSVIDFDFKVFDIGAHIGTFSLAAARKLGPDSNILAVEGNPVTFEMLGENLARYVGPPTQWINAFVGTGTAMAYQQVDGNTGAGHLISTETEGTEEAIEFVSIDQLIRSHFEPDYIKIDVEGMEYNCLVSSKSISDIKPIVYMEVSSELIGRYGSDISQLGDFFDRLGYRYFVNSGERNARHDIFKISEIGALNQFKDFFDVLCVPENSSRIEALDLVVRSNTLRSFTNFLADKMHGFGRRLAIGNSKGFSHNPLP